MTEVTLPVFVLYSPFLYFTRYSVFWFPFADELAFYILWAVRSLLKCKISVLAQWVSNLSYSPDASAFQMLRLSPIGPADGALDIRIGVESYGGS